MPTANPPESLNTPRRISATKTITTKGQRSQVTTAHNQQPVAIYASTFPVFRSVSPVLQPRYALDANSYENSMEGHTGSNPRDPMGPLGLVHVLALLW